MTRRPWKKKIMALVAVVAAIVALLLVRCAGGFGDGDDGNDGDSATKALSSLASIDKRPPCTVRVDKSGVTVGGKPTTVESLPSACGSERAILTVTGDARFGDAEAVRARLREARIELLQREPAGAP